MPNPYFEFKEFTVWHDRCAMKVGTDGVLLGAWAPVEDHQQVLDVGSGTGLIALQLAQRTSNSFITGIEIDEAAAMQATENVQRSPWKDRVEIIPCDFQQYVPTYLFDLIVSNPPYFLDALKCPNAQRNAARHADGLNYHSLFRRSSDLLKPKGQIAIVIPAEVERQVMDAAGIHGFYRYNCTKVFTKPSKPCRRLLLSFGKDPLHPYKEEKLYIEHQEGGFTPEYKALTRDFYLKM